jgi:exopolysaccharide biosynthesis polyprenyl glycosylphosphotransferase
MVYNRFKGFKKFYYLTLVVILSVFFWLYLGITVATMAMLHSNQGYDWGRYLFYQIAAILGLLWGSLDAGKVNDQITRGDLLASHALALRHVAYIAGAILLVLVLLKDAGISRLFLFSFLPLLYLVFLVAHSSLPKLMLRTLFSDRHERRVLLVGSQEKARAMKLWCEQTAELGLDISNFLEDSYQFHGAATLPGSADLARLERTIRQERIQQIIVLEIPQDQNDLKEIAKLSDRLGIRLLVVNNLSELFKRPISYFNLYGVEFIGVREEPLEEPINRLIKRGLDLAISVPVVVFILPPLMLLVAILHRLQSPGPLFYQQTRAGFSRERFRILKFRTMHPKSRSGKQATANDSRVFRAGRWLRRTSLDEFPQFINVLRGEMSVVGPRPHMLIHDRKFCEALQTYLVRSFVKPGITGLAQVRGFRGEVTSQEAISERVKYDAFYLEFWSIWRDLQILFETIKQIFHPPRSDY